MLGSGIPDKGKVLTQLSAFWFGETSDIVPNHMRSTRAGGLSRPRAGQHADVLRGRSMLVRKTEPFPIECVARGYLSGSGWKEYQQSGSVCGITLPAGLRESDRLPEPIFTPATKAATGHDVNISEDEAGRIVGARDDREAAATDAAPVLARRRARRAPGHHRRRHEVRVRPRADGPDKGEIILIDEVLTPDSSRFWPRDSVRARRPAAELRQAVRARLPRIDPLEQAAAGAEPARRRRREDAREIRPGVPVC